MRNKEKCPPRQPFKRILWAWLGAFLGILLVSIFNEFSMLLTDEKTMIVGSFGATAVLLYGAPLAALSQPRNLIGGHIISAIVGVSVFKLIGSHVVIAAPLAVSFAIFFMHLMRTLHPPGGATALIAVVGGEPIHALGFKYVFNPIFTGALMMLLVALLVNNLSRNRQQHYPVYWF